MSLFPAVLLPVALGFSLNWLFLPGVIALLSKSGCTMPNYRGSQVPLPAGIALTIAVMTGANFLPADGRLTTFTTVWAGFSFLGLLDDYAGSNKARGLGGHIKALSRGELSTGLIKVLLGLSFAFYATSGPHWARIVDTLVIALFANALNLFDVRPGRAVKVFLPLALAALIVLHKPPWLALVWGGSLIHLPFDLKGKVMLGDTGANALGATLGLVAVHYFPLGERALLLGMLLILHAIAERYSLSKLIQSHPILHLLDRWGQQE